MWQLVQEAVDANTGVVTNAQIREHILARFPDANTGTINAQITNCCVNDPSRINYPENKAPRLATARYDFLFRTGRGQVERYDPARHGHWELSYGDDGRLRVHRLESEFAEEGLPSESLEVLELSTPLSVITAPASSILQFPLESHLRDFIVQNIDQVRPAGKSLRLYAGDDGVDGVEFQTSIGRIDILAEEENGDLVVFELKLGRGPDQTLGQILRYMGWVTEHLANGRSVYGVIVAREIDPRLRYAISQVPSVEAFEYRVSFGIEKVALDRRKAGA